ncbi:gas vesicle protein [Methanosarcina sp. UBA289]|uniref:gas vesicle protein n=1 Tax=Methanosarcina sp. UBA289 TaxID=1915574 RepID=UPI0025F3E8D6|nr:gas vesicle protein [Methanosarcina sp. UBA289]
MKPEREKDSLGELLNRMVTKGVLINADVIISLAGIPLLGVKLEAAIASIETMLEYGLFEELDKKTRAWQLEHRKTSPLLQEDEEIELQFYGSFFQELHPIWKYCFIYVTNHRIFGWNKAFNKILFEIPLAKIQMTTICKGIYHDEERDELCLSLENEEKLYLHSSDLIGLQDQICKLIPEPVRGS